MAHSLRIGISGWTYVPWRKTFYPARLTQKRELEYASRQVTSIEINGSFYSLRKPADFQKWFDAVPDDFVFTLKANRFITHMKKLSGVEKPLANFFASGPLVLGPKLGPILWQLPPSVEFEAEKFETFLKLLPRDFKEAAQLARGHEARVSGRAFIPAARAKNYPIQHAIEVRHESFRDPVFFKMLRKANVALVTADAAKKWPYFEELTADFAYVRLHGEVEVYASGYTEKALDAWAAKIKTWRRKRDVFVFFDNDIKVKAPFNAVSLLERLVKGYRPAIPMNASRVKNLRTPGPRLSGPDPRWRKKAAR